MVTYKEIRSFFQDLVIGSYESNGATHKVFVSKPIANDYVELLGFLKDNWAGELDKDDMKEQFCENDNE